MSVERMQRLGFLTVQREELRRLTHRIEGILDSLRIQTFTVTSPFDLDGEKIRNYGREFHEVQRQGIALREAIAKLEADLGVDPE